MSALFRLPFPRLPKTLPLFPLPAAVVMPGCRLPLNIFEPRYLNMVFDAISTERMIGMVQPRAMETDAHSPDLFQIGTAGRISSFEETADGRLEIVLTGVCRFRIDEELPTTRGYRRASVDWSPFGGDYDTQQGMRYPRTTFLEVLRRFVAATGLNMDWKLIEQMDDLALCNVLIGALPWEVNERQSLIEAISLDERSDKMLALMEFAIRGQTDAGAAKH